MFFDDIEVGKSYLVKGNVSIFGITVLAKTMDGEYALVRYLDCEREWVARDEAITWEVIDEIKIADWLCK